MERNPNETTSEGKYLPAGATVIEPDWMVEIRADFPKAMAGMGLFKCACQEGWRDLIRWALVRMIEADPDVQVLKIKRKRGKLWIASWTISTEARRTLQEARDLSGCVCEYCGEPGHLYIDRPGWVTCCPECAEF